MVQIMDDTNKVIGLSLIGIVGIMVIYTIIMNTWQIKNYDSQIFNLENFENEFKKNFKIQKKLLINDSERTLFLMEKNVWKR